MLAEWKSIVDWELILAQVTFLIVHAFMYKSIYLKVVWVWSSRWTYSWIGLYLLTVTDVSMTCAVLIFRVKVSCITSVDGIILWLLIWLVIYVAMSTDVIQLTLTLKMTTAQVVETPFTVNNNSPIQDYVHPDDQTQPTFEMTPGLKPFTLFTYLLIYLF